MKEKAFQKLFLEAVDSAFSSLGDSAKRSIYFHLEERFKIARNEIPNRLKDFEDGLEKIFGAGNRFLEVLIMKKLYENLETEADILKWDEHKKFNFVDYVKAAEQNFSQRKKEEKKFPKGQNSA